MAVAKADFEQKNAMIKKTRDALIFMNLLKKYLKRRESQYEEIPSKKRQGIKLD